MEEIMLKLNEFSHNHHPSGVNLLAKIIRRGISVDDNYPEGKSDLYAAFIMRALELVKENGWVGMLTMHSFMFISSYEALRNFITNQAAIKTLAHFGPGLFATGNPGTLQTAAFVLRKEPDTQKRKNSEGLYFRLVHEPDAESKRIAFEKALSELRQVRGEDYYG